MSSRLVCQVLVTFSSVYVFRCGRITQQESDIIYENEPLCLPCCVNKAHCVTLVFSCLLSPVCWMSGLSVYTCLHSKYCHPLEASCIITITTSNKYYHYIH